jgi:hypothetical protein
VLPPAPKVKPTAAPAPAPAPTPKPSNEPTEPAWEDPNDTPQEDPPTFFGEEIQTPTDSIIFVIDRSGSMWLGVGPFVGLDGQVVENGNRLDRAKTELKRSIGALTDGFTFNVIFYDECVYQWLASRVEATAANKAKAFAFIDSITPNGWTNVGMAAYAALQDKDNTTVVLLSDGAPNFLDCALEYVGDESVHREIIRMGNTQGATINTFGIGLDDLARQFMMNVAAENGGRFSEIS